MPTLNLHSSRQIAAKKKKTDYLRLWQFYEENSWGDVIKSSGEGRD